MATLGEQIKALRIKKKMTQDELANKLNTTKAAISRYESGQRQPKLEVLTEIALILEANPDELFGLYFQAEKAQANADTAAAYLDALTKWITVVMPEAVRVTTENELHEWLVGIGSPFEFCCADELDVVKALIETLLALDKEWRKELLEDATRYLEFQEQKKSRIQKLKQGVE